MNSAKIESAPGARELACDLLATYTGNDSLRTVASDDELEITSVELIENAGKTHYITAYHAPENGNFRLNLYSNGIYALSCPGSDGSYTEEIETGHISETTAEPTVRAHMEKMVGALTGHEVKLEDWVKINGIHMGCHLVPCNSSKSPGHSFLYEETGDEHFEIYLDLDSSSDTPSFQTVPFAEGIVSDITRRDVRYFCKLQITDPDLFCKSMHVDTLEEINQKVLLDHLLVNSAMSDSIVSGLAVERILVNDDMDMYSTTISADVIANVENHRAFVALARDGYQSTCHDLNKDDSKRLEAGTWFPEDWYPDSLSDALREITLASNGNPNANCMGFKIIYAEPPLLELAPAANSDTDTPEP